jgi:hypothetical protein
MKGQSPRADARGLASLRRRNGDRHFHFGRLIRQPVRNGDAQGEFADPVQADAAGEEDKIGPLGCFGILFTKIENKGLGKIFLAIAVQSLHGHLDVDLFLAAVEADDAQAKV